MRLPRWTSYATLTLIGTAIGTGQALAQTPTPEQPADLAQSSESQPQPSAADTVTPSIDETIAPAAAAGEQDPAAGFGAEPAAEDGAAAAGWGELQAAQEEDAPIFRSKLYGFIDAHLEKVANTPDSVDERGNTVFAENPLELDLPNVHAMVQGSIYDKYRFFLNLAAPGSGSNIDDEGMVVRNAWVELPIVQQYLNLRAGKTYRRFGLYNEILDAVPTFIGIEPPEIFDRDHLLLTRTTTLMLHGSVELGDSMLNYSATSGNDERDEKAIPFGADVYVELPFGLRLGSSFYTSGGKAIPSRAVGDGSPRGGVANWMKHDKFFIVGGYAQLKKAGWILQAEYWYAKHNAERDPDALALMAEDGGLNAAQRDRFWVNGDPTQGINRRARYAVNAFYFRGGYEFAVGTLSSITPYAQFDYYSNPETVNNKDLGGDAEAGLTDNGAFEKYTLGVVLRPVPQAALKIDGSGHRQNFNGKSEFYPEVRFSLSYLWELSL